MSRYDDMINLPHYEFKNHKRMSIESRSAQFAPFSALTGYEDEVKETARFTDRRIEIDEGLKEIINNKLQYALENKDLNPDITFTYFIPDGKKNGGKYIDKTGQIKKIDDIAGYIILKDKEKIKLDDVINVTGEIYKMEDYE